MNLSLRIFLIVCILVYFIIIFSLLKRKRLNLKYVLIWFFSGLAMLIVVLFPDLVFSVTDFVGIESPVNTVFVLEGMFVLLILLTLTSIVSNLNNKIYRLAQTQAILEKKVRDLEKKLQDCEEMLHPKDN